MPKQLTRSRDDRWLGGVCGGLAEYAGVDATLIRVVVAVAIILGAGSLIVIYAICWALIPVEPLLPPGPPTVGAPQPPSTSSH